MNDIRLRGLAVADTTPPAAPVRVSPLREYRGLIKDKARLLDQIEDSMGQKVQHAGAVGGNPGVLGFIGLTPSAQVKAHAKFLSLRPDEQTVFRGCLRRRRPCF